MRTRLRMGREATVLAALAAISLPAVGASAETYRSRVEALPAGVRARLAGPAWRPGCPVALSGLRLLTVTHWDFDGRERTGRLIVNARAARSLERVFGRLHALRFPIRHLRLSDMYGPASGRPPDGDVSGSFECRQAVPSPCSGGSATGSWSNHAYGLAVDLNPNENPYVGCGRSRGPARRPYLDRTRVRPGMVTPAVVAAFADVGWEWGGAWSGATKDYMHFSHNGH